MLDITGIPDIATEVRVQVAVASGDAPWALVAQAEPRISLRVDAVPAGVVTVTAEALGAGAAISATSRSATVRPDATETVRLDLSQPGHSYAFIARGSVLARLAHAKDDRLEVSVPLATGTNFTAAEAALGGPPTAAEVRSVTVSLDRDRSIEVDDIEDVWAGEVAAFVGATEVGRATPSGDKLQLEWVSGSVSLPAAAAANLRHGVTVRFEGEAADDDPEEVGALDVAVQLVLSR